jgi:enoyl-[acyl-carrier-protein] reductase (NADH)
MVESTAVERAVTQYNVMEMLLASRRYATRTLCDHGRKSHVRVLNMSLSDGRR